MSDRTALTAFLDRDGTINQKAPEGEYVTSPAQFHYLPGAEDAIRLLADAGWRVVVVTNQRGIALGRMTAAAVDEIHRHMLELPIAAVYVCPHEKGVCDCRKPGTGLFLDAQRDFPEIDFGRSVVIGDAPSDLGAGDALGCRTILVGSPPLPSLLDAARRLVSEQ
ncbi:MAG: D-glycero-D-manno-heptose 1,7-bisphosphate phosphatase [Gaiellales bacterium]|nr:D-glycero-D-manno-heptose 1,7-bisphosphate phosphatase [Gaiellales bacterium]